MSGRQQKQNNRQKRILQELAKQERISVQALSALLQTTQVTIRNDLTQLERSGKVIRVHGGAVLAAQQSEQMANLTAKEIIAAAVAAQIRDGDTIFINSGTTSVCVARALKLRQNLNVVTNSLDVATELGDVPTFRILLLGGEINARYRFTYGGDAQEQLQRYQANWAILSVDGVSCEGGITTYHAQEAILDKMMIAGARQTLIVADSTKIGKTGFTRVQEHTEGLTLVTDAQEEALQLLQKAGWKILGYGK